MTKTKQNIFLILFSLIILLSLLEISLRLGGYVYYQLRSNHQKGIHRQDKNAARILCLGDSFTFGLGAESGYDYPAQLERLLNRSFEDRKFIVYNRGIPGQNSSHVLKRLVNNIITYKPEMILLLVGSNDSSVLEDSNLYLFKEPGAGRMHNFFLRTDIFFSKLRIYKLIRVTVLNLKSRFKSNVHLSAIQAQDKPSEAKEKSDKDSQVKISNKDNYFELVQTFYNERKFSAAEKIMNEMPRGYNSGSKKESLLLSNVYYELEKYDLALAAMQDYIKGNPKDATALFNMARIYYMQGRNNLAIKEKNFACAIRLFEETLLYAGPSDLKLNGETYSYLARLYFDQGENEMARKMAENALTYWPDNSFLRQFMRVISQSSMGPEEHEIFNKLLYYNFGNIINLCRLYNIKIVILNYPQESQNSVRKEIANKYKVPFIDIGSKFSQVLSKSNYKDLFSDDANHPNANGYKVMAKIILDALKHEELEIGALR